MARRQFRSSATSSKVVGYVRVSTDEQALGPEAQRAALAKWCAANNAELVAVHHDLGISGGAELERRPGLLAALEALRTSGAGVLLVAKRDRLARDVVVAAMVERLTERAGARVLTADGTGNGDGPESGLMRGIIDVFAQYERALIRARTKAALAVKKSRGERVGEIPFGFRVGNVGSHLEANKQEQETIGLIVRLRRQGLTISAIVDRLTQDHVPARGSRWHATTVSRLLRRAA